VIHLGGNAAVANVRVHGIGKINTGCTLRQIQNLALGREHINLIREQVDLDVFEEFDRIARFFLQFQQGLQPLVSLLLHIAERLFATFVHPVAGYARIGHPVHVSGANLHLDWRAIRPE